MATAPCSTLRTLTIVITPPPDIPPANGYTIKWRIVGSTTWNVVSNLYGTTLQIPAVPSCYNIEGTIQADCAGGSSNPITFAVTGNISSCESIKLESVGVYTYTPCGGSSGIPINVTTPPQTICAIVGTVISDRGLIWSSTNTPCT
jgi:hypothetical protein